MALQTVLVFSSILVSACTARDPVPAIIGGRDASYGEFPHQVSLQTGWPSLRHYCGGTLIHRQWVLTAAHCVMSGAIYVKAGKHNIRTTESTEQIATVLLTIKHDLYQPGSSGVAPYDIAMLKLSQPFQLNSRVNVIALPAYYNEPVGNAILSGWGSISRTYQPVMPSILQTVTLPVLTVECCKWNMYQVSPKSANIVHFTNLCTYSGSSGQSSCSGDSGGPLIQVNSRGIKEIIGIVSWGLTPCGTAAPSVYVNVSYFVEWIRAQIAGYQKSS